jgi:hypothetical protein
MKFQNLVYTLFCIFKCLSFLLKICLCIYNCIYIVCQNVTEEFWIYIKRQNYIHVYYWCYIICLMLKKLSWWLWFDFKLFDPHAVGLNSNKATQLVYGRPLTPLRHQWLMNAQRYNRGCSPPIKLESHPIYIGSQPKNNICSKWYYLVELLNFDVALAGQY